MRAGDAEFRAEGGTQQKITHLGDVCAEHYKHTAVGTVKRGGERYGEMQLLQYPHGEREEQMP